METWLSDSDSMAADTAIANGVIADTMVLIKPVRGTGPMLILGMLLTLGAMTVPRVHIPQPSYAPRPAPAAAVHAPRPLARPSVYAREAAMSPAQLMKRWDDLIGQASRKFHVPKTWIVAVMRQESGGRTMMAPDKPIVSSAGAMGLMQIDPKTYDEIRHQYGLGSDPFDAHDNIFAGTAYLRWLHKRYGYPAMFAAYNAGPGRLEDHLHRGASLPAQTRAYVGGITRVLGTPAPAAPILVTFTRPDGRTVRIDAAKVTAVNVPSPGEYGGAVQTVVSMGAHKQAIRENLEIARSAIRAVGGLS
jgi:hypothetical protein